jgi:hypothetical protein
LAAFIAQGTLRLAILIDTATAPHLRFRAHLIGACILMLLAIWLSSGTMYPFASTWAFPIVSKPCAYLFNQDHPEYRAAFDMLDGAPRAAWQWSMVLRRVLYPLVAFPFMKAAGFLVGGFIASVLINLAALVALAFFLRKRWGDRVAVAGVWLLACYPGVTYWGALPYATAAIVPASLGLFMLLTRLDEQTELRSVALNAFAMSLLFTAYDLLPYFGVAAMIVLIRRRRWRAIPIAAACMAIAPAVVLLVLTKVAHLPLSNPNTDLYGTMLKAYLHPPALGVWLRGVANFPVVLGQVFFFSNLVFLPMLFLLLLIVARVRMSAVEGALAVAIGLVFMFNNLAPPYPETYYMRGDYIPRIYQPLCAALIVYCARVMGGLDGLERVKANFIKVAFALVLAMNLSVAFGPIARVPWAGKVYQRFYLHSFLETMDINLARHGRRPLGFCKHGE